MSFADKKITEDIYLRKKGIVADTVVRKREAVDKMAERLNAITAGCAAIGRSIAELTPLLSIEALNRGVVNLLIDKILVHGENDIEIIWNG